ncbi:hypothetical protein ACLMJK_005991 [Lecanora helva]
MPFTYFQKPNSKSGHLLGQYDDDEEITIVESRAGLKWSRHCFFESLPRPILIWATFMTCYAILMTALLARQMISSKYEGPNLIYTRIVMEYQVKGPISAYPDEYRGDPFFGDPSLELDQRWNDRMRCETEFQFVLMNTDMPKDAVVRLSFEELSHYNQSGILLEDKSGYLATPTVYHDLHCIRYLHKIVYRKYYFPNDTEEKHLDRDAHARHCLHNLDHSLTCNADMTMRVMRWHPHSVYPSPVDHEHECVNMESIEEWAKERYVDPETLAMLVHPTKGQVFPDGKLVKPGEQ